MFFNTLRQRLASVAMRIVSVNDLYKKLSPACNFNTSNLKIHMQEIVIILEEIITSAPLKPPAYKVFN